MTDAPSSPDDADLPDEKESESDTPPEPGDPGTPTGTALDDGWLASPDRSKGRDTDSRRAGIAAPQG